VTVCFAAQSSTSWLQIRILALNDRFHQQRAFAAVTTNVSVAGRTGLLLARLLLTQHLLAVAAMFFSGAAGFTKAAIQNGKNAPDKIFKVTSVK
jgi:hypothetical protein